MAGLLAGLALAGCAPKPDAPPVSAVFFMLQSTDLDGPAQRVIGEFVADAKASPQRPVYVRGYANRLQMPGNQALADRRAKVVANALVNQGIAVGRINILPRAPTDNDPGVESRRVELTFNP